MSSGFPEDETTRAPAKERAARGVPVRTVWYVAGGIAILGAIALVVLAVMWRGGRLSGVDSTATATAGAIATYVGYLPTGGSQRLEAPRSVSTDGSRIYVTEPDAGRISVFELDGRFVRNIPVSDEGTTYPVDADVLGESLYVIDAAGQAVLELPVTGGSARRVAESLTAPTALTASGETLLIADAETGLWRLTPESGELQEVADTLRGFAGEIALDGARALVTDTGGSRVLDVALGDGAITVFGERVNLPRGIAVDGSRRVWVADVFGGTVVAFDAEGTRLGDLEDEAVSGTGAVELESPQGVAFASSVGRLYVADSAAGRVMVFSIAR